MLATLYALWVGSPELEEQPMRLPSNAKVVNILA
jgi:hypothetical protein